MSWIKKVLKKIFGKNKSSYTLIMEDYFKNVNVDNWTLIPAGKSAWNLNKIADCSLISMEDFGLRMYAKANKKVEGVIAPEDCITVGLYTKNKVSAAKGKVEVVARFSNGRGSWPAIWLAGENNKDGDYIEIDITEYLNKDLYTNTTIHSTKIWESNNGYGYSKKYNIVATKWNTYSAEWDDKEVKISINGKTVNTYTNNGEFGNESNPMFLLIDTQLGGKWVGDIYSEDLPVWMDIKSVKFWKKS